MSRGEQPRAPVAVQNPPGAPGAVSSGTQRRHTWWRTTLLILLAFVALGAVPILLLGQLEGVWRLHIPGAPEYYRATPTSAHTYIDIAPRQAWISTAALESGFPATITAHTTIRGVL